MLQISPVVIIIIIIRLGVIMELWLISSKKYFWVIRCVVYILKIMGLAPFSLQNPTFTKISRKTPNKVFGFSKIGLAYNLTLLILIPALTPVVYPNFVNLTKIQNSSSTIGKIVNGGIGAVISCVAWVVIGFWTFRQRTAVQVMNSLLDITVKLANLRKHSSHEWGMIKFTSLHFIIYSCLWIFIGVTELLYFEPTSALAQYFYFVLPSVVVHFFAMQYSYIVGVLARELQNFNKQLLNFKEFQNYFSPAPLIADYLPVLRVSTHNHLAALQILHNIRTRLFELSQEISDLFSFPTLLCIGCLFLMLVLNMYNLIVSSVILMKYQYIDHNNKMDTNIIHVLSTIAWTVLGYYPFVLLFHNVTKTVKEAELTGRVIYKLSATSMNSAITRELQQFSLHLLHENVNFTACGFFTLDFTLLHSILGASATYLVILIQFQVADTKKA